MGRSAVPYTRWYPTGSWRPVAVRAALDLRLEVVDLLELRLDPVTLLVVLVRRVRAPVAGRGEHLAGDDRVGLEHWGTAKLRTSREQLPAPRSSTGTSSAATCRNSRGTRAAHPRRADRDPGHGCRPGDLEARARGHVGDVRGAREDRRATQQVGLVLDAARVGARDRCGTAQGERRRTPSRARGRTSARPASRVTTRRPVCCQPGREASTSTSQPSRRAVPLGRNHCESLPVIVLPGSLRGPALPRCPPPRRRRRPAGTAARDR